MMTFGERLVKARLLKGLSQKELSNLLKLKQSYVNQWENDINLPRADKIIALSNALDVTTDFLLKGDEEKGFTDSRKKEIKAILKIRELQQVKKRVRGLQKFVDRFNKELEGTSREVETFLKNEVEE